MWLSGLIFNRLFWLLFRPQGKVYCSSLCTADWSWWIARCSWRIKNWKRCRPGCFGRSRGWKRPQSRRRRLSRLHCWNFFKCPSRNWRKIGASPQSRSSERSKCAITSSLNCASSSPSPAAVEMEMLFYLFICFLKSLMYSISTVLFSFFLV